jgi:hypothetical protein
MATPFLDLIRAILPNFKDKQLRQMIAWFEAVSAGFDAPSTPQIVAMANIGAAGAIQKNYGFDAPVLHPGTGQYALNLEVTTYDINDLIVFAQPSNMGTPGGAIFADPVMTSGSQVFINMWQIAVTTAARTAVDQEFQVFVLKMP